MDILTKAFSALWQVLAVGLLLGVGIPALFSIGMRSLERGRVPAPAGATNVSTDGTVAGPAGKVGAAVCFGICILAVLFGIIVIIFGKQLFAK
jgi:hypothetical protein